MFRLSRLDKTWMMNVGLFDAYLQANWTNLYSVLYNVQYLMLGVSLIKGRTLRHFLLCYWKCYQESYIGF